jgi:cyclomaltodextrinase
MKLYLRHPQTSRFISPLATNQVLIRLQIRPQTNINCTIWYWDGSWHQLPMHLYAITRRNFFYQVKCTVSQTNIKYFFETTVDQQTYFLAKNGRKQGTTDRREIIPFTYLWRTSEIFTTPNWVKQAVFYQIFPERFANGDPENDPVETVPWDSKPTRNNFFGGDLAGIIKKIPYLKELGITAIWLNPIFSSQSNHKYNTRDYLTIDTHFGNNDTFHELVNTLHANGIKIILDGVFNHTSDDFWAFQDVLAKGRDSRYVHWYYFHHFPVCNHPHPNYDCWWNFPELPKLNVANPEVRKYLLDVAAYWTQEYGIDGWRLDVPNEVSHDFWIDFRRVIKKINPDAFLVGEIWRGGRPWLKGDQFDAVMNYLFRDLALDFFARRKYSLHTFNYLLSLLRIYYPEQANYCLLNLLGSHDTARVITEFQRSGEHPISYHEAVKRLLPVLIFQMTYLGVPLIYYGDEVGITGGPDPDCRKTMVWNIEKQNRELWHWYQRLINLRHCHPALREGDFQAIPTDYKSGIFAYKRTHIKETVLVIFNTSDTAKHVPLSPLLPEIPPHHLLWEAIGEKTVALNPETRLILKPGHGMVLIS